MANFRLKELSSLELAHTAPSRYAEATQWISLALAFVSLLFGAAYYLQGQSNSLPYYMLGMCLFFLLPYGLCRVGHCTTSRLFLAVGTPCLILIISVLNKIQTYQLEELHADDYFDVRIVLLALVVIPMSLVSITEKRMLLLSLLPSFLSILLFDPIHQFFNVGFYDTGLHSNEYYFSANLFSLLAYLFLAGSLYYQKYNNYQKHLRLHEKSYKLELYLDQLMSVGNSQLLHTGQIEAAYGEICAVASKCLGVSRVSIWRYKESTDSIHCLLLKDQMGLQEPGTVLYAKDYPEYFDQIRNQSLLIAEEAQKHPAMARMKENYLMPLNIVSVMDAPFKVDGKLEGIICCEQQGEPRPWKTEDSIFLRALADFINYLHSTETLVYQRRELQEKNEEISTINEQLEERISTRTHELELKNYQLSEYAFINSHLLRAPVARISGLVNIIEMMYGPIVHKQYTDHIKASVEELDAVTRRINQAIEEYGEVSRQDIKAGKVKEM